MKESTAALAEHCQAVGRDPASIVKTFSTDCVAVAHSTQAAVSIAQGYPVL